MSNEPLRSEPPRKKWYRYFLSSENPNTLLMQLVIAFASACLLGHVMTFDAMSGVQDVVVPSSSSLGRLFIWLLTPFVVPLVAASVWIAITGNSKSVGIALVSLCFFAVTTSLSLASGALNGYLFEPGVGLQLGANAVEENLGTFETALGFVAEPVVLPWKEVALLSLIITFAAKAFIWMPFFPRATILMTFVFKVIKVLCMAWMEVVLKFLPLAVFFMAFGLIGEHGLSFLVFRMGKLVAADVCSMVLHQFVVFLLMFAFAGTIAWAYFKKMCPAYLMALGNRSSMGTLPKTLECASEGGIDKSVSGFIFPFGATVNMDGTCAHIMVCVITIFQAYDVVISWEIVLRAAGTVMMASVATAAVPGASIALLKNVAVAVILATGMEGIIPPDDVPAWVTLFASIDFISDALRTQTNIFGDSMAALFLQRAFYVVRWTEVLIIGFFAKLILSAIESMKPKWDAFVSRLPERKPRKSWPELEAKLDAAYQEIARLYPSAAAS